MKKRTALIVLDGWGHGEKNASNAIYCASTPFTKSLYQLYPNSELRTDGENVGLPEGQMGNSEVGHMNLGAGRIVYQDLVRVNKEIRNGELAKNPTLQEAFHHAKTNQTALHLMGLVSNGGVHSHLNHLKALCNLAVEAGLTQVFIHAFTDGRDTDPKSGRAYISELEQHIKNTPIKIASIIGRYYSMDRDQRWERIKKAYDLLVHGHGAHFKSAEEAMIYSYEHGKTDEFVEASLIVDDQQKPIALIKEKDVVICFNFRTDRCRQITRALTQESFHEQNMHPLALDYYTLTNYNEKFIHVKVILNKANLDMTLGEAISRHGMSQMRIAETEKYPHVTFFFSGGREAPFERESRIMINSPNVATYDLQPEMSALKVADAICKAMDKSTPDFICLNFANADMVGHTGVFTAIVKAVETVDSALQLVVECGLKHGYSFVILADHGNADKAVNEDGSPNTAHTTNPVPVWVIGEDVRAIQHGVLADIAPTILQLLDIPQPSEMTGKSIIS